MFAEHPEILPDQHRSSILKGQIQVGMTPFEAKLAGGAFSFKVIADAARWPEDVDPLNVMWSQSMTPDDSQIWMTFKNNTQYPTEGERVFKVFFRGGKALEVEKLEK